MSSTWIGRLTASNYIAGRHFSRKTLASKREIGGAFPSNIRTRQPYRRFMGRDPDASALLQRSGLA